MVMDLAPTFYLMVSLTNLILKKVHLELLIINYFIYTKTGICSKLLMTINITQVLQYVYFDG